MITYQTVLRSRQLAGRVTRWHTWPMIRKPTVAEGSARVATLYCEIWGLPRAEVLYYVLHHDNGEIASGDTPFYAKREVPELAASVNKAEEMGLVTLGVRMPELTETEYIKFKVADVLEMWETAVVELTMGNKFMEPVVKKTRATALEMAAKIHEFERVSDWLMENEA